MSRKRDLLSLLTRDELLAVVERFDLSVGDRRVKEQILDSVTASHKATLEAILTELPRDRLKDLCRARGLDDSGREKAKLVDRLLDSKPAREPEPEPPAAPSQSTPRPGRRAAEPEQIQLALGETLSLDKLERHLWSAADILRGSIDSSDYKNYIFGLLFLKRMSDRFDEECELLRTQKHADPEDPDEHDFFVPPRARWASLQRAATNLGEVLNTAAAELERRNARTLEGVLAGIDFNDERKLGDSRSRDTLLARLIQHFSRLNLSNRSLSEPDMLGRAYEYLIEKFADDAGKKGGEFYTPKKVVELLVELLEPRAGMRICDPTVGSGGMLIECAHYVEQHERSRNLSLYGQEKNLGTWAICKMNMLLHGITSAQIEKGDTIRDPKLLKDGALMPFDRVIANPPFSLDEWGRELAERDPFGRFTYGVPPKTKGDLAFLQHMIATTNKTGRVGVVMPHGVLFRGAAEGEIRRGILEDDLFEAVIGLPSNLFYGTGIPAAILLLNRSKRPERAGRLLFIDASREFKEGKNQNTLRPEDVQKIVATFRAFQDVPKYARVVPLDEVRKNDFNLNISRYVETAEAAEKPDVAAALRKLRELEQKRREAEERMNGFLRELGYDS